ncbi:hypothetical protein [Acinetobacter tandoii]|uniref:hypothetical protein n=1 Tax=Acinetobacter tandoii TaxID=202954 RepID=UPI0013052759|nr:hypothetical protein [Acinetobacter tandoii]
MIRNIMLLVLTATLFTGCLWYDDDYDHRHHNGPPQHHDSDHRPDSNHHDHMNNNDYDDHIRPAPR